MSSTASSIAGFTIVPLKYSATATHNLYVRAHTGAKPVGLPQGRTLFLNNVPPDATERELGALFGTYGTIERVAFPLAGSESRDRDAMDEDDEEEKTNPHIQGKKRKLGKGSKAKSASVPTKPPKVIPLPASTARVIRHSGGSAHIVFLDTSSYNRCLSSIPPSKPIPWPPANLKNPEPRGLANLLAQYHSSRPTFEAALAHAESAILAFDWQLQKDKRQQKSQYHKGEEIVDEDGFTLVVRGGAYGQSVGGGIGVTSKRFELNASTGKDLDSEEKESFYAFQIREKNLKDHATLRKQFEEDKKKVEEMRKQRAFVPY
ncbi:ribosomal RNA-processing protein 7-domain-containing protein [Auriculariales sp. MPI-PUGE-AT-0066]|nr:ribosomal RNA-processing protein 7-domain-containing protein [Auriculariales sp. MPI-PUGE-AT-0066]